MIGPRRTARRSNRRTAPTGRRTGPPDEAPWWDDQDQTLIEQAPLRARQFGRGWVAVAMAANAERLDPFDGVEQADAVRTTRSARRPTALDEGRAWHRRADRSLAVLRLECFAETADDDHRATWQRDGPGVLDAVWRARWRERDLTPGWIEARWFRTDHDPAAAPKPVAAPEVIDWLRVEDHTDPTGAGEVTRYEHLTVWAGRSHAVLVVRHDLGVDLDGLCARLSASLHDALAG